jgi:hypothetical protein
LQGRRVAIFAAIWGLTRAKPPLAPDLASAASGMEAMVAVSAGFRVSAVCDVAILAALCDSRRMSTCHFCRFSESVDVGRGLKDMADAVRGEAVRGEWSGRFCRFSHVRRAQLPFLPPFRLACARLLPFLPNFATRWWMGRRCAGARWISLESAGNDTAPDPPCGWEEAAPICGSPWVNCCPYYRTNILCRQGARLGCQLL